MKELPFRPCVGIMLVNASNHVFIGRRVKEAGPEHVSEDHAWQMPQGGIDEGEDPFEAALRELREETNVTSVSLIAEAPEWFSYELPKDVAKQAWKGRYRGQTQKWFAFRFEGEESEINIHDPAGAPHPEFDEWRWERPDRLSALVIPFKRAVYEQVVTVLVPHFERDGKSA
jgi:putative (di)nucleoside polyphosphate hydrolase